MVAATTSQIWFILIVLIVAAFFFILSLANTITYFRLKVSSSCNISGREINILFWTNLVLTVVSGLLTIWALWRLIFTEEARSKHKAKVKEQFQKKPTGFVGIENTTTPVLAETGANSAAF